MKILLLDVESNGLHGEPFAVGAVIVDTETLTVLDTFEGIAPIVGPLDEYVAEHVQPVVKGLTKFQNTRRLRNAFWLWFKQVSVDAVFADVGYPVETRFLQLCQRETEDLWGGPYPLHEVATLLLAAGVDPDVNRAEYADGVLPPGHKYAAHAPLDDATVSAHCVAKALRTLVGEPVGAKVKKAGK